MSKTTRILHMGGTDLTSSLTASTRIQLKLRVIFQLGQQITLFKNANRCQPLADLHKLRLYCVWSFVPISFRNTKGVRCSALSSVLARYAEITFFYFMICHRIHNTNTKCSWLCITYQVESNVVIILHKIKYLKHASRQSLKAMLHAAIFRALCNTIDCTVYSLLLPMWIFLNVSCTVGLGIRKETYSRKKHGGITFMCACHAKTGKQGH